MVYHTIESSETIKIHVLEEYLLTWKNGKDVLLSEDGII